MGKEDRVKSERGESGLGEGGGGIRDWCSSLTMVALYYYNIINCINSSLQQGVFCVCVGGGGGLREGCSINLMFVGVRIVFNCVT